jgi:hypothetical protein
MPAERGLALEENAGEILVGAEQGGKTEIEWSDADTCQIESGHDYNPNC